ncbi:MULTISPECIES: ATP-binding cassette domain-containing protein [unclassified Streptomyces]|uniref:ABC transporter permease subunit n=1 Tax=unclassified Streptomyces TaxID=2593676 RepID=UPI0006F67EE3|nr:MULTISPECIES: ATP-binding cassette domain-containing protein [unclassified Streptomyces]KQX54962.1 ABC transporter permease [Streptomyces sp. Root1304]KRA94480.1 ABC transporter permease [Streptomyces sp. Root66D1]
MASLTYELTLAGLAVGAAAALTGIGLVVTYRATGVLNLAHGAVAMICAYVLRQLVVVRGWPLPAGALVTLLVVAPGLGLVLDRLVFRPLARREANPARTLVASIGVFVLLVGAAVVLWGPGARDDAPVLLGDDPWAQLATVVALACLVGAVTRWTRFGRKLRAVVDNRPLAVLSGIDADRVAAAGWAFGAFTAGLTGVLLAPYVRLDPYGMPLLVMEVIAVAVIARMRSLPVAVAAALVIGVAQAQLTRLHPEGWAGPLLQAVGANLFVVALLVAALVLPGIGGKGRDALPPPVRPGRVPGAVWPVAGVLFLLPLGFAGSDLHTAVQVPALSVILLSLVVVAGRGGQIALGQAAYAGLGALFTALLTARGVPGLTALGLAVPLVAVAGLLTGGPAIRRHGLALALATLATGVAVSRFVLTQPYATADLSLGRPAGFTDDRAFYALELVVLAGCLALVAALRRGRTGRGLAALRDHEPGAEAAGVPVPRLKLLAFVLGAALAALGGGLLGMGLRAFDPEAYDPVRGLLWFAAVLVLGADSLLTPLVAAALLTTLDAGPHAGVAALLLGLLAAFTARVPPLTDLLPTRGTGEGTTAAAAAGKPHGGPGVRRRAPADGKPNDGRGVRRRAPAAAPVPVSPAPRLRAHDLTLVHPGGVTALDHVSLALSPGRVTALVGPNGAGKSTLFDCLAGTLRPRHGRITLDGTDITSRSAHARTRLGIARSFQRLAVFPSLTVEENVRVGEERGHAPGDPAAVERSLRLLGLAGPVRHAAAGGLPTGTLRRVELARALAGRPHTLLLDEPAAGLDAAEAAALSRVLAALAADGLTVLVVEHDPDLVAGIAHTVHTMEGGRIVS